MHWNCILTGSFVVRDEHTGEGVKHIYCYWTWLSVVVVHTWPSLVPGCLAKGRSSQNIKTLLPLVATGRWIEKCSEKRNCRNVAQPRSEPNRSAYLFCRNYCRECRFWCTALQILVHQQRVQILVHQLPRLHQTWTLVGIPEPKWNLAKFN